MDVTPRVLNAIETYRQYCDTTLTAQAIKARLDAMVPFMTRLEKEAYTHIVGVMRQQDAVDSGVMEQHSLFTANR